nr:DUF58 domain-containing protein [Bifidobacterium miconis]
MRVVDDDLNFHGLREYRPGDDLRGVHWLSTARTGRLMVRQYEASHRIDVGLDLDAVESDYADHDEFELAVSVFASIGAQCLLACRPLSACVGGERIRPRNAMEFLDFCSAIVPRRTVEPSHAAPSGNGHAATDARNNHVLRCSVIGSRHTARNGNAFPAVSTNTPHIVLRTAQPHGDDAHGRSDGERPAPITTQGPVTARIGTLDALPSIMEGWS